MRDGSSTGAKRRIPSAPSERRQDALEQLQRWRLEYGALASRLGIAEAQLWDHLHRLTHRGALRLDGAVGLGEQGVGEKLRSARRRVGLSLKQAARLTGYTPAAVQRWEKEKCLPKPGVLLLLCSVYATLAEDIGKRTESAHPPAESPAGGHTMQQLPHSEAQDDRKHLVRVEHLHTAVRIVEGNVDRTE
jgi:transcriptional regulator with XRE-family HTH domain